jgi:hypothetical protein
METRRTVDNIGAIEAAPLLSAPSWPAVLAEHRGKLTFPCRTLASPFGPFRFHGRETTGDRTAHKPECGAIVGSQ